MRRAREAERYAPDDIARLYQGWYQPAFIVEPADAEVAVKNYLDVGGDWEPLGRLPLTGARLPFGYYRVRLSKAGYAPREISGTRWAGGCRSGWREKATSRPAWCRWPAGRSRSAWRRR